MIQMMSWFIKSIWVTATLGDEIDGLLAEDVNCSNDAKPA